MAPVCFLIILIINSVSFHCVTGRISLTRQQETVFNLLSGGLSQIVWTEDAIPAKVSERCHNSLVKMNDALNRGEQWPFRFLDATSKSASGIMDGTFSSFGDYDECLAIKSSDASFSGSHCLVNLTLIETKETADIVNTIKRRNLMRSPSVKFLQGICVPSTCTPSDVSIFIGSRLQGYPLTLEPVERCDTQDANDWMTVLNNLSLLQMAAISFIVSIVSLVVIGTNIHIVDVLCQYLLEMNIHEFSYVPWVTNSLIKCSAIKIAVSLVTCEEEKQKVSAFRKSYVLFVISEIVLGASLMYHFTPARFVLYRTSELKNLAASWIVPFSSHAISSALCFTWGFKVWRNSQKRGPLVGKTVSFLITTSLCSVAIVAFQILIPILASGPIWNVTSERLIASCQQNWWTHLLLVANIYPSQCAPHLIIMSVFGQLLLLSLCMSLVCRGKSLITLSVIFALLATFARSFLTASSSLSSGVLLDANTDEGQVFNYLNIVHNSLSSHAISFILGTLGAHLLPFNSNAKRGPLMKTLTAIVIFIALYSPYFASYHRLIPSSASAYFVLSVKAIGCLAALLFTLISESEVPPPSRKTSSSSQASNSKEYKMNIYFMKANYKLAESIIFVSLLYIYFDFFTSRILLPVFQFTVLKRTLYSMVNIYSLSISFHLFILSPIKVITKIIFTGR